MKKFFLIFIVLNCITFAQKYEDVGWMSKFGAAIGYTPSWMIPNVDPLNNQIKNLNLSSVAKNGLYVSGGGGYIYLMMIKDLRVGGTGYTGSVSEENRINGYNYQVDYSISGGGLTIEYTLPFIRRVGVSVGAIIGSGWIEVDVYKNKGAFDWDDVWTEFRNNESNDNISRKLSNNFYTFTPTINLDIPFTRFASFRIGGGYQISIDNEWKVENNRNLKNVPTDLNGNAYFLQAGILVGFFAF